MEYITSRQNPLMVLTAKLLSSRKHRKNQGLFAGDGTKLLEEAVKWAPERLYAVILQEGIFCPELPERVRRVTVPRHLMEQISDMEAPEGALFLMKTPEESAVEIMPGTLVLDGIQDPGNLGTILRTADAMDVPVILTEGCADPYNPKTVRATMGAVFRTPPGTLSRQELLDRCRAQGVPLYAAALSERAVDLRGKDLRQAAVVIGSEGRGVSPFLLEASDGQIIIPMHSRCESLNAAAAAAIVLWQMTEL
ncbi:MAG: RNA methyltransferase [Oscillospiraceae bacterium]|nr:RNA methyltransferase [Oscillospiraceae bacterium]